MKLIKWFVSFFAFYIFLVGCNSKQKLPSVIEDSTKLDTIYTRPMVQVSEERRVYDSVNRKQFALRGLSHQCDILLSVTRFIERDKLHDSCIAKAILIDKQSKNVLDSVSITSLLLYSEYFTNRSNFTSYSTGRHVFKELVDNYAGDLIVADFNFDGKDDVALVNDMGGNGGPLYSYFIQQPNQKFLLDRYLTDSMEFFPSHIDRRSKTLTTYVHAGACCVGKHVYRFDSNKKEWKQIERVILGMNKPKSKS